MSETKFTPGPWQYDQSEFSDWGVVRDGKGRWICQAKDNRVSREQENEHRAAGTDPWEANARLIASAPDMYEALKRMVAHYDRMRFAHPGYAIGTELPAIVENARAALSKAEGAP